MKLKLGRGQRRNRRAQLAVDARAERRRAASQRVYAVLAAAVLRAFIPWGPFGKVGES